MALPSKPTREPSTLKDYKTRVRQLVDKARKEMNVQPNENMDYRQFVGWLITQKSGWSKPTWRQNKAAVVSVLEQEAQVNPVAHEAHENLIVVGVEGCLSRGRKTSANKLKKFPLKDYKVLTNYLQETPSPWHTDLKRWLVSSLLTGLRPQEWAKSVYMDDPGRGPRLYVDNAKKTNLRSHGEKRILILDGLTKEELEIINTHAERAREFRVAGAFTEFQQGCSSALSRATRTLWPNRKSYPTLYSARHQFTADAKASGYTREEIAAMMGHAVDRTASQHYGRKTAGLDIIRIRPDPGDVEKVRQVYKSYFAPPNPKNVIDKKLKNKKLPRYDPPKTQTDTSK